MAHNSGTGHMDKEGKGGNYTSTTLSNTREPSATQTLTAQSKIQPSDVYLSEATGSLHNLDLEDLLGTVQPIYGLQNNEGKLRSSITSPGHEGRDQSRQKAKCAEEIPRPSKKVCLAVPLKVEACDSDEAVNQHDINVLKSMGAGPGLISLPEIPILSIESVPESQRIDVPELMGSHRSVSIKSSSSPQLFSGALTDAVANDSLPPGGLRYCPESSVNQMTSAGVPPNHPSTTKRASNTKQPYRVQDLSKSLLLSIAFALLSHSNLQLAFKQIIDVVVSPDLLDTIDEDIKEAWDNFENRLNSDNQFLEQSIKYIVYKMELNIRKNSEQGDQMGYSNGVQDVEMDFNNGGQDVEMASNNGIQAAEMSSHDGNNPDAEMVANNVNMGAQADPKKGAKKSAKKRAKKGAKKPEAIGKREEPRQVYKMPGDGDDKNHLPPVPQGFTFPGAPNMLIGGAPIMVTEPKGLDKAILTKGKKLFEGLRTEAALQAGDVTFDPSTIAKARLAAMHQPPMTPEAGAAAAAAQVAADAATAAQASARTKRGKKKAGKTAGKQKTINMIANDKAANDEAANDEVANDEVANDEVARDAA